MTAERGDAYGGPATSRPTPAQIQPQSDARRWIPSWLQLSSSDLEVLQWWVLTRVAILLVVLTGPSLFLAGGDVPSLLDRWKQWDFWHFDRIATHGYFAPGWDTPIEAFFPGLPMVMRVRDLVRVTNRAGRPAGVVHRRRCGRGGARAAGGRGVG